jgi:protein-disulfide isomerase
MSTEVKILAVMGTLSAAVIGGVFVLTGASTQNSIPKEDLLVRDNSNTIEQSGAKITLVEFGDYQCPACAAAHPIVKQILSNYEGRITFVFRHFPLSSHKNARDAARAAEAAGSQGKYWEMHYKLYGNQEEWANSNNPIDIFAKYAGGLNLDVELFKKEAQSSKFDEKINGDQSDGIELQVNSTPTFFFNGEKLQGVPEYNSLKERIDKVLSEGN